MPIWPIWSNFEVIGLNWQCCLAGSSKTAPRIFIFSIVLGAENLSYVKSIETHARAFLTLNILFIGTVFFQDSEETNQSAKINDASHSTYRWNIKCQKCARMGLNGFHIR